MAFDFLKFDNERLDDVDPLGEFVDMLSRPAAAVSNIAGKGVNAVTGGHNFGLGDWLEERAPLDYESGDFRRGIEHLQESPFPERIARITSAVANNPAMEAAVLASTFGGTGAAAGAGKLAKAGAFGKAAGENVLFNVIRDSADSEVQLKEAEKTPKASKDGSLDVSALTRKDILAALDAQDRGDVANKVIKMRGNFKSTEPDDGRKGFSRSGSGYQAQVDEQTLQGFSKNYTALLKHYSSTLPEGTKGADIESKAMSDAMRFVPQGQRAQLAKQLGMSVGASEGAGELSPEEAGKEQDDNWAGEYLFPALAAAAIGFAVTKGRARGKLFPNAAKVVEKAAPKAAAAGERVAPQFAGNKVNIKELRNAAKLAKSKQEIGAVKKAAQSMSRKSYSPADKGPKKVGYDAKQRLEYNPEEFLTGPVNPTKGTVPFEAAKKIVADLKAGRLSEEQALKQFRSQLPAIKDAGLKTGSPVSEDIIGAMTKGSNFKDRLKLAKQVGIQKYQAGRTLKRAREDFPVDDNVLKVLRGLIE